MDKTDRRIRVCAVYDMFTLRKTEGTVPTSNSCTTCVGKPGKIHDRTPDCKHFFLDMDAWMT